jgi:hypothetical protein
LPPSPKITDAYPAGRNYWVLWGADVTSLLDGRAGPAYGRNEVTLELIDGNRPMTKFAISTKGFNEAIQKANTVNKSIKDMLTAKKCSTPPLDDIFK